MGGEGRQLLHIVDWALRQVSFAVFVRHTVITVKHGFQHFVGGFGIGTCTMSSLQLCVTEETIGAFQGARLHLHEDIHHVNEITVFQAKLTIHTQELLHQHGQVELKDIVTSQISIPDKLSYFLGLLPKRRFVFHQLICITMYSRGLCRDRDLWIEQPSALFLTAVGIHFQNAYFHNAVMCRIQSRGLQVKKGDRAFQI